MTVSESTAFVKSAISVPHDQRTYRKDIYGPMRVGLGAGYCACDRKISKTKATCLDCSRKGLNLIIPGSEPLLAPGVRGYQIEVRKGEVYIPLIAAEEEGSGLVGLFLDALPTTITVKFPNVVNEKFLGMLQRRGFVCLIEHCDRTDEDVAVWARMAIGGQSDEKSKVVPAR